MTDPYKTFVLVHGAWHTGWCWHSVAKRLEALGHAVHAPDLPLEGSDRDLETLDALLDSVSKPQSEIVLVGHSYGGILISQAASGRQDIDHLVYVCAFCTEKDEPTQDYVGGEFLTPLAAALQIEHDRLRVDGDQATSVFYADCPPDLAADAIGLLRPMAMGELSTQREPGWKTISSTYVECLRDRAVHPDAQRKMSRNATHVVQLDTDHSPFLSMPEELVEILINAGG